MTLLEAVKNVLAYNGGLIDAADTVDGVSYVMVREDDFRALDQAVKSFCPECHGTGKRLPGFVNVFDPCPCTQK